MEQKDIMERVKTLIIRFKNILNYGEIPQFRGAIINTMNNANILFHNHSDEGYRYAYPLIQYKSLGHCATIVCIGEGTEAIGEFFRECNFDIVVGSRNIHLQIEDIKATQTLVQQWNDSFTYHINRWMPLNQENYDKFKEEESLVNRDELLEHILTGNILSFAKGIGLFVEQPLNCKLTGLEQPYSATFKGNKVMCFDASFTTNISLPAYIGLGKGVSLGYGIIIDNNHSTTL